MMDRDIVSSAPASRRSYVDGRKVIAVVGIDRYHAWPRLDNAVNDAMGALKIFESLGFERLVAPLINETATGAAIRRLVTDDLAMLGSSDSLVLFVAGHGHTRTRNLQSGPVETGFLIPVDGDPPSGHTATWLRLDAWLSDVARLAARHVLVILDACHSGIVLGSLIKWRGAGDSWGDNALGELHGRQSRRVITSALGDQRAMDGGPIAGHSLFTGCLLEGLAGGIVRDRRRMITGSEIGLYVQQRVASYTRSRQTPDFGTFELDERGELVVAVGSRAHAGHPTPALSSDGRRNADRFEMSRLHAMPASQPYGGRLLLPGGERAMAAVPRTVEVVQLQTTNPVPAPAPLPRMDQVKHRLKRWSMNLIGYVIAIGLLDSWTAYSAAAGGFLMLLSTLLLVAIIVGWASPTTKLPVRWISAVARRNKLWTIATMAGLLFGISAGMSTRPATDEVSRPSVQSASGRQSEVKGRGTATVNEMQAQESASRQNSFDTAIEYAEAQPDTFAGARASVLSYKLALGLERFNEKQAVDFGRRLRSLAVGMEMNNDDGASAVLKEAEAWSTALEMEELRKSTNSALPKSERTPATEKVEVPLSGTKNAGHPALAKRTPRSIAKLAPEPKADGTSPTGEVQSVDVAYPDPKLEDTRVQIPRGSGATNDGGS